MLLGYSNFQNYFCVTILIKNADIINWRRAKGAMFGKQECKRAHKTKTNPETIVNKIQNADTKIQSSSSEFLSLSRHVDASSEGVKNSTKCLKELPAKEPTIALSLSLSLARPFSLALSLALSRSHSVLLGGSDAAATNHYRDTLTLTNTHVLPLAPFCCVCLPFLSQVFECVFKSKLSRTRNGRAALG